MLLQSAAANGGDENACTCRWQNNSLCQICPLDVTVYMSSFK